MADRIAEIFAALGSEEALDLVIALLERPDGTSVTDLAAATGYNQPKVTRTIQALNRVGLIARNRGDSPLQLSQPEEVRRLIDQVSVTALRALAVETETATARQRRTRKTRLAKAKGGNG